jgi:hypothetical protein
LFEFRIRQLFAIDIIQSWVAMCRACRLNRTIPDLTNPVFPPIVRGIKRPLSPLLERFTNTTP